MQGLTTLVVGVVVIAGLYLAREVLIPITLAVLLSFVLAPLVMLLRRVGLPRVPAVVSAVVLALGIILALATVIGSQVAQLAGDVPRYASTIEGKVDAVRGYTLGRVNSLTSQLGRQVESAGAVMQGAPAKPGAAQPQTPAPIPVEVHQPDPDPMQVAQRLLAPILSPLATTGIVFIVAVFILMQKEDMRDRLIRLFGSGDLHRTTAAMDEAAGAAQPLLPDAARAEHRLRRGGHAGAARHRRAQPGPCGG